MTSRHADIGNNRPHVVLCNVKRPDNSVRQKKGTNFFLCASFLVLDRNWSFFTYIRPKESRSISYNFVLILVLVENFAATLTVNVLCLPVK